MKKEDFRLLLNIILVSALLLVVGNLFNLWSFEGSVTKCKNIPVIDCYGDMRLHAKYKGGCVSGYYCVKSGCAPIEKSKCGAGEFLHANFDDLGCLQNYECYDPGCPDVLINLNCTKEQDLVSVYGPDGCVKDYICSDINEHSKNISFLYRVNQFLSFFLRNN